MPADHVLNALEGRDTRGRTVAKTGALGKPTIAVLRRLMPEVGVAGATLQKYAAGLWRYYLGHDPLPPAPPTGRLERAPDGSSLADWTKLRAWQALEAHEDELPPLLHERKPKGA